MSDTPYYFASVIERYTLRTIQEVTKWKITVPRIGEDILISNQLWRVVNITHIPDMLVPGMQFFVKKVDNDTENIRGDIRRSSFPEESPALH